MKNGGFGFHFYFRCERRIVRIKAYKHESLIELQLGNRTGWFISTFCLLIRRILFSAGMEYMHESFSRFL